jgi:hypothetical protein
MFFDTFRLIFLTRFERFATLESRHMPEGADRMKRTLQLVVVNTVSELRDVLDLFRVRESDNLLVREEEIALVNSDGDALTLRLVEETLSDGSKVYNVEAS